LMEGQAEMVVLAHGSRTRVWLVRLLAAWVQCCQAAQAAAEAAEARFGQRRLQQVAAVLHGWRQDTVTSSRLTQMQEILGARWQASAELQLDAIMELLLHELSRRGHTRPFMVQVLAASQAAGFKGPAPTEELATTLGECPSWRSVATLMSAWFQVATESRSRRDRSLHHLEAHRRRVRCVRLFSGWALESRAARSRAAMRKRLERAASQAVALRANSLQRLSIGAWMQQHRVAGQRRRLQIASVEIAHSQLVWEHLRQCWCAWHQWQRCLAAGRAQRRAGLLRDALELWRWGVALTHCSDDLSSLGYLVRR